MIQPDIVELNSSDSDNEDEISPMPKIVEEIIDLDSEDYHQTHKKDNILKGLKNNNIIYTPNFIKFVDLCLRLQDNRDMRDILKVLIIPSYGCAEKTYVNSTHFNTILISNINHMEKHGNVSYTGIKRVVLNIKANRGNIATYDLCDDEARIDLDTKLNKSETLKKATIAKNNHKIELHNGDNSNNDISNLDTKLNKSKGPRKNNNTKCFKELVLNNNSINNVIDLDKELNNIEGLRKKNKSKILNEIKLNNCNNNTNVDNVINSDIELYNGEDLNKNKETIRLNEIELNNSNNPNVYEVIELNTELSNSEKLKKKLKRPHHSNKSNNSNVNKVIDFNSELNNSEDLNTKPERLNEIKLNNTNNSNVDEVIDLDTELNNREDIKKKKKTKRLNKEELNNGNNSNVNKIIDLNTELNNCEDLIKKNNLKKLNEFELNNTNNLNVNKVVDLDTDSREDLKKNNKTKLIDGTELNSNKSNDDTVLNLDMELYNSVVLRKMNNMVQLDNNVTNLTNTNICHKFLYDLTSSKNNGDVHHIKENIINNEDASLEINRLGQISFIEAEIKRCKEKIQKCEETEVNFDEDSHSPYVLCDKLKLRLLRLYEELCYITNSVSYKDKRRPVISLKVPEGHPPGPARHLEAWFNRPLKKDESLFPDFMDVVNCVAAANVADSLQWTPAKVLTEARSLFKQCGKQLQKRRQKREWRHLQKMLGDSPDPADLDPELEAKLQRNKIVANKREDEVVEFYCNAEKKFNERNRRIKLNDAGKVIENHTFLTPIIPEPESKSSEIKEDNIHHNDGDENKANYSNKEVEINNQYKYCNVYDTNFSKTEVELDNQSNNDFFCKIEVAFDNQYNDGNVYGANYSKMEVEIHNQSNTGSVYKNNFSEIELDGQHDQHDNDDTYMNNSNKIEADNEINNNDDAYTDESEDSDIELIEESFVFIKDENDLLHVKKEETYNEEYLVKEETKMEIKSEVLSEKDVLSILCDIEKKSTNGLNIETQIIYEEPTVTIIFDSSDDSDVEDML